MGESRPSLEFKSIVRLSTRELNERVFAIYRYLEVGDFWKVRPL